MKIISKVVDKNQMEKEKEILDIFCYPILSLKERKNDFVVRFDVHQIDAKYNLYLANSYKSLVPFYPVILFSGLAILFITILLILFLINKKTGTMNLTPYFIGLAIPAFFSLFSSVAWTFYKSKIDVYNLNLNLSMDEIKNKIDALESK